MPPVTKYRSQDRSQQIPTTGIVILTPNIDRVWAAFNNLGPGDIDIYWIADDGVTVEGRLRLLSGGSLVLDSAMYWPGALSATAVTALTTLVGVEVETI